MRFSGHAVAVALALLCSAVRTAAQPGAQPSAQASASSISGVIRNASDGAPIARARVVATGPAASEPRVTISGGDGHYELATLPPDTYKIDVSHTGFVPGVYGERRGVRAAGVPVANGQRVTGIDVALTPAGAIAGRILDEDGTPFAGARVSALASRYDAGQRVAAEVAWAQSDDRGEFRIFGLPPGEYYVSAIDPAFASAGSGRGPLRYGATYYPGTSYSNEARPVAVAESGETPRIEFKLRIVPPAWVSGQLLTSDRRQLMSGAIIMSPLDDDGVPAAPAEEVTILPDGRFTFGNVPPGRYRIRARGETEPKGLALFSQFAIVVRGEDIDNVQMTLRPGALLDGTVELQRVRGTKPPVLARLRVRAPFTDGGGFGDALTGTVAADGTFAIRGVMDGQHQIVVEGLTPPWVVTSVRLGGYDVADEPLDAVGGQHYRNVRVTITDVASEVLGRVRNARGTPAGDAAVIVYPIAQRFWFRTNRRLRFARTDAGGTFSVYGLPPGEYLAVASYALDEGDLGRKSSLDAYRPVAAPFTIETADARVAVDLRLETRLPPAGARR